MKLFFFLVSLVAGLYFPYATAQVVENNPSWVPRSFSVQYNRESDTRTVGRKGWFNFTQCIRNREGITCNLTFFSGNNCYRENVVYTAVIDEQSRSVNGGAIPQNRCGMEAYIEFDEKGGVVKGRASIGDGFGSLSQK
jgi:hypothetical protein